MWENSYINLVLDILANGELKKCRNGIVKSVFGKTLTVDMQEDGFPILQGRKIFYKGVFGELAAMLSNSQSIQEFKKHGCNYWDSWANKNGKLNIDYGRLWRNFNGIDQLLKLRETLKCNPNDRRLIISGWNPENLEQLSLPCCHMLYQWYVRDSNKLDMIWYQRSVDTMIGLPSDIIFAAAWNLLLCNELGFKPGKLTFMLGDTHIYSEHFYKAAEYISIALQVKKIKIDYLINSNSTVDNFCNTDIALLNYKTTNVIKFKLKE